MRYSRGNVQKERDYIERPLLVELELKNVTVNHLKSTLDKIGVYPKPVPKIGRPFISIEVKRKRKLEQELELGILNLFH